MPLALVILHVCILQCQVLAKANVCPSHACFAAEKHLFKLMPFLCLQTMELCYHGAVGRTDSWATEMQRREHGRRPSTTCAPQNAQQCTVEQNTLWLFRPPRMRSTAGAGEDNATSGIPSSQIPQLHRLLLRYPFKLQTA